MTAMSLHRGAYGDLQQVFSTFNPTLPAPRLKTNEPPSANWLASNDVGSPAYCQNCHKSPHRKFQLPDYPILAVTNL
jgi:hypothetical protein